MSLTGVLLYGLLGAPASAALPAADDAAQGAQGSVATRARVVSVDPAPGSDGKRYIRLQLLPRARLPFSTLTFRVRDPALLDGIAEGVEDKQVIDYLRIYHCDEAQGYYYSRPLPPQEFMAYLKFNSADSSAA